MQDREVQFPKQEDNHADHEKRIRDLERQFAAFRQIRNLDDLEDTAVPYAAPPSNAGPDGWGGPPQDGQVLTWDTSRDSQYGGLAWFQDAQASIGPVICSTYEDEGIGTYSDGEIFGMEPPEALWLISAVLDCGPGVPDAQYYINVNDDSSYFVAADRATTNEWTSFDHASVCFVWWPPVEGSSLHIEGGAHNGDDTLRTFTMRIRAVRLGPAPTTECGDPIGA